jgi:hypothetical protein
MSGEENRGLLSGRRRNARLGWLTAGCAVMAVATILAVSSRIQKTDRPSVLYGIDGDSDITVGDIASDAQGIAGIGAQVDEVLRDNKKLSKSQAKMVSMAKKTKAPCQGLMCMGGVHFADIDEVRKKKI